jgi:hypothetical protein
MQSKKFLKENVLIGGENMVEVFKCRGCGGHCHLEITGSDNDIPPACPYGYNMQAYGKWEKEED